MTSYCGGVGDSDLLDYCSRRRMWLIVGAWTLRRSGYLGAGGGVNEFVPEERTMWTFPSYSKVKVVAVVGSHLSKEFLSGI